MKILELHHSITEELTKLGIADAKEESFVILGYLLNLKKVDIYLCSEQDVPEKVVSLIKEWIEKRKLRIPLAYIIGEHDFWSRSFKVTSDVLIPRPETELLVEKVILKAEELSKNKSTLKVLDLGAGSGAISITLGLELPYLNVFAVDKSYNALKIAHYNKKKFESYNVNFFASDWFSSIKGSFDIIVSNPPYIDSGVLKNLQPELAFEPVISLDGGLNGLYEIKRIFSDLHKYLVKGGWFFMEIGFDQKDQVIELARASGAFDEIEVLNDYAGLPRIFKARHLDKRK